MYECTARGKLRLLNIKHTNPISVGDYVKFIKSQEKFKGEITKIFHRKNYIIRRSVNLSKETHVLASNLDQAILVITLKRPKTYFEFIEFFNKMGLMYNQMYSSSLNLKEDVKTMITNDVPEAYHNYIHIGITSLKNDFMNIITEAIYNSKFTESEALVMNNLKIIGGMNVFDMFLQMYSDDIKDTMGGQSFINMVSKIASFMNKRSSDSFKHLSERIIDSIRNDIQMKEKLFLHTNYDTDVLINFMKNFNMKDSFQTQALQSVSKTNIDLFVEIKVKNMVLQILSIIRSQSVTESTKILTHSMTDLFYIIPYYSYKHRYSVEFSGGGKYRYGNNYKNKTKNKRYNTQKKMRK